MLPLSVKAEEQFTSSDVQETKDRYLSESGLPDISNLCGYIINDRFTDSESYDFNLFNQLNMSAASTSSPALKFMQNYPLIPVVDAQRLLGNTQVRDNFFERVFVVSRWQDLISEGLTAQRILKFHAQHKLIIMSHVDYRDLGQLLAKLNKENIETIALQYITQLMTSLLGEANRSNHVNVLQHIQGHLKKELSPDNKTELNEIIDQYRMGVVPLMAVLTLFNHHFRKFTDAYIQEAYYMHPYPYELTLVDKKTTG